MKTIEQTKLDIINVIVTEAKTKEQLLKVLHDSLCFVTMNCEETV